MKPYQNRKKGHMKMYQIDFNKPIHIHFMGIGGISMSGLAEILIKEGFTISGSDVHTSDIIKILEEIHMIFFDIKDNTDLREKL